MSDRDMATMQQRRHWRRLRTREARRRQNRRLYQELLSTRVMTVAEYEAGMSFATHHLLALPMKGHPRQEYQTCPSFSKPS